MRVYKITSLDGDCAIFFNGVLIAYYDVSVDSEIVKPIVDAVADNLCRATDQPLVKARFEKNEEFVHWETSEQVQGILHPNSPELPSRFISVDSDDSVVDDIVTAALRNTERNIAVEA